MEQFLVTEKSSTLRRLGRDALRGRWMLGFGAILIYYFLSYVPSFLMSLPIPFTSAIALLSLYPLLMTGPLNLGYSIFALSLFRDDEPEAWQIFYGFERFGKAFGLMVVIGIFTFLWSLLFIIPGIIAALRYSQAFFILADNPDIGILECIDRSKRIMNGNKGKLFLLGVSFIGWFILAMIPVYAVSIYFRASQGNVDAAMYGTLTIEEIWQMATPSSSSTIVSFIASTGMVFLQVYIMAALTAFYEVASGNLRPGYIASTAEIIDEPEDEPQTEPQDEPEDEPQDEPEDEPQTEQNEE
ncbi:MAG: DUF975 family protein [Clostridiales bacterium]|nr:DUF975 family protein [Clostridiales bacterium]